MAKVKMPVGVEDPKLIAAYSQARRYLRRKNVTGISIGHARRKGIQGDMAICIHVSKKIGEDKLSKAVIFPRTIGGIPVDIVQSVHKSHGLSDAELRARRTIPATPAPPGVAISGSAGERGTLGMIVVDNRSANRDQCVLTAAHVLADPEGTPVYQPSPQKPANRIGSVGRSVWKWECDAAIAPISGRTVTNLPMGSNHKIVNIRQVKVNDVLTKSGCMTGITKAVVSHVGEHEVEFDGNLKKIINGFQLAPLSGDTDIISDAGDSGAVWYEETTGLAVGLHVAGDSSGPDPWAFACHLTVVFPQLDIGLP